MDNFTGTLEGLQNIVREAGQTGDWEAIAGGHRFRQRQGGVINWFLRTGQVQYQGPPPIVEAMKASLANRPQAQAPRVARRVFVVHGHDENATNEVMLAIHELGLEPFVLARTGGGGRTLIEALEREITGQAARDAGFGIVLMTPDDMGYAIRDGEGGVRRRPRQNVVLEMGMLLSAFGRARVAVLQKGGLEQPSDAAGIIYIQFNERVREAVPRLVHRLQEAGFELDPAAITRATA